MKCEKCRLREAKTIVNKKNLCKACFKEELKENKGTKKRKT